jgi:beta-N-acetylhexosaminidase
MPVVVIDLAGPRLTPDERAALASEPIAGVCLFSRNVGEPEAAADLVASLHEAARRELVVAIDQEGGSVVRLRSEPIPPSAMALGAVDDPALTEAVARATARSLRRIGVNVDFAPVADVQSNRANPVIGDRSFGADPDHVARHVAAAVRGLQGAGVAATLKHFPGHGDVDTDSHLDLPTLRASRERLARLDWPPFRSGIAAGAAAVMTAHLLVPALDPEFPSTLSRATLTGVLRDELGFDGVVFTDALDMRAVRDRWHPRHSAVLALAAGADAPVSCGPLALHLEVVREIEVARSDGRIDAERLAAAEARIERLVRVYPSPGEDEGDDERARAEGASAADATIVAEAARRAVVAVGGPARLRAGEPVALYATPTRRSMASDPVSGASDELVAALERLGVPVRRLAEGPPSDADLGGVQALIVTTCAAAPLGDDALSVARSALERARSLALPAVHVALWNPANVAALPAPAIVTFGFRRSAAEAAARALLTGDAPGIAPVPLEVATA